MANSQTAADFYPLLMNLVQKGIGWAIAIVLGFLLYRKDREVQRLTARILRVAMSQSKDAIRQEETLARLKQIKDQATERLQATGKSDV